MPGVRSAFIYHIHRFHPHEFNVPGYEKIINRNRKPWKDVNMIDSSIVKAIGGYGTKPHPGSGVPGCMRPRPSNGEGQSVRAQEIVAVLLWATSSPKGLLDPEYQSGLAWRFAIISQADVTIPRHGFSRQSRRSRSAKLAMSFSTRPPLPARPTFTPPLPFDAPAPRDAGRPPAPPPRSSATLPSTASSTPTATSRSAFSFGCRAYIITALDTYAHYKLCASAGYAI